MKRKQIVKSVKKIIEKNPYITEKFNLCSEQDQEWVLDYRQAKVQFHIK